ncbi:putative adhesin [Elioraea sp.]|uniref:putative adhesin n=1 Tax=Elioraea sp. TaxID=2185103 RepID=UPI0021DBB4CF|nr:hypothetical protein [Elioraea sp.]GIX10586.1 MAG: hypothetical protein KatS3mg116_2296 [Elioraea sp.]
MAKTTPAGATPIGGGYFYLFKSATNSTDCLISAHGGYIRENRTFTVPAGIRIVFYGQHGAALNDPGIFEIAKKLSKARPVEIVSGGQKCLNYLLSKYQGAHAGASGKEVVETYDQVARVVQTRDFQRTDKFKHLLAADPSAQSATLQELMADWGGSILTVRNRWNVFLGMPLKDAVKAALKEMPSLRTFHCIFCRSYMLGEDPLAAQSVQYA